MRVSGHEASAAARGRAGARRAAAGQRRGLAQYKVNPGVIKREGRGNLHYAFKTKKQIDAEENMRRAAEWNEWDLESRVRYKALQDSMSRAGHCDENGNKPVPVYLRFTARDDFRGGMPRPMDLAFKKLAQKMPASLHFDQYRGDDLTNLDLGLMLKYVDRHTIPNPVTLLDLLFRSHHILDDYSCGHYMIYCRWMLQHLKETGGHEFGQWYGNVLGCWDKMRQREGGSRCTLGPFAYQCLIKACVPAGDLTRCLGFKHEMLEHGVEPTAGAWEGILECCADSGATAVAWAEWREMRERHGLAPTEYGARQMLRICAAGGNFGEGVAIWQEQREALRLEPTVESYTALFELCAACRESAAAMYHWHELFEYTRLRPDIACCDAALRACAAEPDPLVALHRAQTVLTHIEQSVLQSSDETFRLLFQCAGRAGDLGQLEGWWAKMQQDRSRPSLDTLHAYLAALLGAQRAAPAEALPPPGELMTRGLTAYDWAGRSMVFSSDTFLLLLHLCAQAGEPAVGRVLLRKMLATSIPHSSAHVVAMIAAHAASDAPRPLRAARELAAMPLPAGACHGEGLIEATACLLTARGPDVVRECGGANPARRAAEALWRDVASILGLGSVAPPAMGDPGDAVAAVPDGVSLRGLLESAQARSLAALA